MTRLQRWSKAIGFAVAGGILFSGGCLPDNIWSLTAGSAITGASTSVATAFVLRLLGLA